MVERLAPFREKRQELAAKADLVNDVLAEGSRRATEESGNTLAEVRSALKF
jgi:tryptophanyl-tRNA synthetase